MLHTLLQFFIQKLRAKLLLVLAVLASFCSAFVQAQTPTSTTSPPPTELRFSSFFRTPIGPKGLELSDALTKANGQSVTLVGYMVQQETPTPGAFMLAPRPVTMSEQADGDADDLPPATVLVYLDPTQKDWVIAHARGLVSLTGVLAVGRHEGANGRISWVQLQLGADATRGLSLAEQALYRHRLQHQH